MSCNYADGLSPYIHKGKCGLAEIFDTPLDLKKKVAQLAEWMKLSKHTVLHTGAGISTAAGIPDFRGPSGVWTLEKKGEKPRHNVSFEAAKPTKTHMAIVALYEAGFVKYVISQNVDGLHLKSGLPRSCYSEVHGNMFIEQCPQCERQFVRGSAVPTVGQVCLNKPCPYKKVGGRVCRGKLYDNILDWEADLPQRDLDLADENARMADLSISLGTTLQIIPSGNLPLLTKRNKGKFVICNLQPTKHDRRADLLIRSYVDSIMQQLCDILEVSIPDYDPINDPSVEAANQERKIGQSSVQWTLPSEADVKNKITSKVKKERKRKYENVDANEILPSIVTKQVDVIAQEPDAILKREIAFNEPNIFPLAVSEDIDVVKQEDDADNSVNLKIKSGC